MVNSPSRMDLPDQQPFTLRNVPLDEGLNSISTTLVGAGGESVQSAATTVTRDDIAPVIKVLEPTQTVYTDSETLVGTTEPGADIQITDGAGHEIESSINGDGRFSATLEPPRWRQQRDAAQHGHRRQPRDDDIHGRSRCERGEYRADA